MVIINAINIPITYSQARPDGVIGHGEGTGCMHPALLYMEINFRGDEACSASAKTAAISLWNKIY